MYSSLHRCSRRQARCFDFHVSLKVVVDNSFFACFCEWRRGLTAASWGKSFLWLFAFGLWPLLCVWFAFPRGETQIWLGDLRVVRFFLCCFWFVVICLHCRTFWVLVQWCFTAYAHVRTEPECDIGHTRGKKKRNQILTWVTHDCWGGPFERSRFWEGLPEPELGPLEQAVL